VALDDVEVVVNCHLHFDHCGGNQFFPRARIVVQRCELEEARTPVYTVQEWVDFEGAHLDVVDGEHSIWEDARVMPTPGHTRGHQSLVLDTRDGPVILAGQAAESAAGFEEGIGGWGPGLEKLGAASLAKLKSLSPHSVLFAHDGAEWGPGAQRCAETTGFGSR
jgi:glyoxylase-like metal-dependent hydrolase (beta-lactamase superfamily II)